jgi:hypothetical protein
MPRGWHVRHLHVSVTRASSTARRVWVSCGHVEAVRVGGDRYAG